MASSFSNINWVTDVPRYLQYTECSKWNVLLGMNWIVTQSRLSHYDSVWCDVLRLLEQALAQLQASPSIDLFASRLNNQRSCYVSYRADPEAHAVDAFSLSWTVLEFSAFPPFSLITRVLQKVKRDRSTGVIIVPIWPTQVWWPVLMKMITGKPVQLASRVTLLTLPSHPEKRHRLLPRLKLLACKIYGADTNNRDIPGVQLISCWILCDLIRRKCITLE